MKSQAADLKKQVRVRPHFHRGAMDGFRVTRIKKGSVLYDKLGLRNGDIISAVDDKKLNSAADVRRLYNGFTQKDGELAADIRIKRKGESGTLSYLIN